MSDVITKENLAVYSEEEINSFVSVPADEVETPTYLTLLVLRMTTAMKWYVRSSKFLKYFSRMGYNSRTSDFLAFCSMC